MIKKLDKCTVFCPVLFATAFLFWWLYKPEALYYQEIFQMFVTNSDYFIRLVQVPGGLADYISEFLVQYYHYPALGGAIIALLYVCITLVTYRISRSISTGESGFCIIHALPATLLWYVMSDINVMHSTPVAILMALLISWHCCVAIGSGRRWWTWLSLALIPAGYMMAGPAIYIALIISVTCLIRRKAGMEYTIATIGATILAMATAIHFVMYPVPRFLYGIDYFRYHNFNIWIMLAILTSGVAPVMKIRMAGRTLAIAQAAAWILAAVLTALSYSGSIYQSIKYLKLAHQCNWKEILADAGRHEAKSPQSMILVNTALAFEQRLASEMFRYRQTGNECLLPDCRNDLMAPLMTAEAYFWMGLTDHAIRNYFESRASNPTYRGSCYATMRLAECYIINEDYQLALKYLYQLRKTTFMSAKASEYIYLIESGQTGNNAMIAAIRSLRLSQNRVQGSVNNTAILKDLIEANPYNYLAYEYLMATYMLEGDLQGIAGNAGLCRNMEYQQLPTHVQEAIALMASMPKADMRYVNGNISQDVATRFHMKNFAKGTFWNYYLENKK